MINHILKEYIDKIVMIYLDDYFIFNKILKEYKEYIYFILIMLKQVNLYVNIYKSIFVKIGLKAPISLQRFSAVAVV